MRASVTRAHPWTAPSIDAAAREILSREDPAGLARFTDKVAATARVAASTAPVAIQAARAWDEKRFPAAPTLVVIETTTPPAPEAWLAVTLDDKLPSADGPETPAEQTTTLRLEPAFFIDTLPCTTGCDPANTWGVGFRRGVRTETFARALTVRDLTGGGAGRPVSPGQAPPEPAYRPAEGFRYVALPMAGYERQPAVSTWALRVDASLEATDGQSLGYTWMGVVETAHERPYAGWTGQVWEAKNGPLVPFLARNTTEARQFLAPMAPADSMPRLLAMQRGNGGDAAMAPPVAGTERRFTGRPDAVEAHGIDLRGVLGAGGTGLVWGAISPTATLPGSSNDNNFGWPRRSLLQVTNLGLSVKDSPQSTLVFVTRLDNAEPVAGASVAITDQNNRAVWRGTTNADGVAIAPAPGVRQIEGTAQLIVRRHRRKGRRRGVGRLRLDRRRAPVALRSPVRAVGIGRRAARIDRHRSRRLRAGRRTAREGRAEDRHAGGCAVAARGHRRSRCGYETAATARSISGRRP